MKAWYIKGALSLPCCLFVLLQRLNFKQRVKIPEIFKIFNGYILERDTGCGSWVHNYEKLEIVFTFSVFPSWIIYLSHWDYNWRIITYLLTLTGIHGISLTFLDSTLESRHLNACIKGAAVSIYAVCCT